MEQSCRVSSSGRATASQAVGGGFESRILLQHNKPPVLHEFRVGSGACFMLLLRFYRYCAILFCELNKNSRCVPPQALCRGRNVKREAGANPARSRHCDKGVYRQGAAAPVTGTYVPGRRRWMLSFQPGNLPAVGTGAQAPDHEELVVPKKPEKTEKGLFALPSRKQKGPFCFAGHSFLYLLFSKNHVQKQERNEQK